MSVHEAAGDCEVIETNNVFEGPFPEYDAYGNLTASSYVTCRDCGREILTGRNALAESSETVA